MPTVVDLQRADDPRDVIHQAVQVLAGGGLVISPTETQYVVLAAADHPEACQRMEPLLARRPALLGLKSADEALDYVPAMSRLGRKLTRRCWPGPVALRFPGEHGQGMARGLDSVPRDQLDIEQSLTLRVSAHEALYECLRLCPAPVLMTPEPCVAGCDGRELPPLLERLGETVDLAIDDGSCRYGDCSTIVQVNGEQWKIEVPGVVSETTVGRLASEVYLFVCTGNTCRSPMAEGLFRHLLAERIGCGPEELVDHGYVAASAGLAAGPGFPASPESVQLLQQSGIDISAHESQQLTMELLNQVDFIYTMTRGHRDAILAEFPEIAERVNLLSAESRDISDPIGGGIGEYENCRREIENSIRQIVDHLPLDRK